MPSATPTNIEVLSKVAIPIADLLKNSCRVITDAVGDAQVVLLGILTLNPGEATHGTQEFYTRRADITKALIEKKGFTLGVYM
jgi:erythromycin esterase-like protein